MDMTAFFKLNYGLYVISAMDGTHAAGCVVNTLTQVTAEPARVTVAVNKGNATAEAIRNAGYFAASVLTEDIPMDTISLFGFRSSREVDKFAQVSYGVDDHGTPYLNEGVNARFACKVLECWGGGRPRHALFERRGERPLCLQSAGVLGRGHAPAVPGRSHGLRSA